MSLRKNKEWSKALHYNMEQAVKIMKPTRILLAEDEDGLRDFLVWVLRHEGYEVIVAHDGVELLDYLASSLIQNGPIEPIDLIITDVRMPGWNGMQILEGIRATDWAMPVILITGYGDVDMRREAYRLGAAAFFDKPFDVDILRRTVANILPANTESFYYSERKRMRQPVVSHSPAKRNEENKSDR